MSVEEEDLRRRNSVLEGHDIKTTTGINEDVKTDNILTGYAIDKPMTFREDMYSLLFIHLVKPQYKKYCDLVAKTG